MPDLVSNRDRYVRATEWRMRVAARRYRLGRRLGLCRRTRQQSVYDWTFRSDEEAVKFFYAASNDHLPDLDRPVWLNEKIRWQFLHHRNPLMTLAADKIAVRDYLREMRATIEPPQIFATGSDPEELADARLPSRFVLKSGHGSAQMHLETGDKPSCRKTLGAQVAEWNSFDWWRRCGELHYRGIPKRWLAEEYLPSDREKLEFKVFCFMGEPRFVTVITERDAGKFKRVTVDLDWKRVRFWSRGHPPDPREIAPPAELDRILDEARRLAQPFLHVRVDFLKFNGRLAFSELTFAAMGALLPFEPLEANAEIGALIDLSQADARLAACTRIARRLGAEAPQDESPDAMPEMPPFGSLGAQQSA